MEDHDLNPPSELAPLAWALSCPICKEVLDGPVSVPCGHVFCSACIRATLDFSARANQTPSCPSCREKCQSNDLRRTEAVRIAVQALPDAIKAVTALKQSLDSAQQRAANAEQELAALRAALRQHTVAAGAHAVVASGPPSASKGTGACDSRACTSSDACGAGEGVASGLRRLRRTAAGGEPATGREVATTGATTAAAAAVGAAVRKHVLDTDAATSADGVPGDDDDIITVHRAKRQRRGGSTDRLPTSTSAVSVPALDDDIHDDDIGGGSPDDDADGDADVDDRDDNDNDDDEDYQPSVTPNGVGSRRGGRGGRRGRPRRHPAPASPPGRKHHPPRGAATTTTTTTPAGARISTLQSPYPTATTSGGLEACGMTEQPPRPGPTSGVGPPAPAPSAGNCPVCGTSYPLGVLQMHVEMCLTRRGMAGRGAARGVESGLGLGPGRGAVIGRQAHAPAAHAESGRPSGSGVVGCVTGRGGVGGALFAPPPQPPPPTDVRIPPKLSFHQMNARAAKKALSDLNLPSDGTKEDLARRYTAYRTFLLTERDRGTSLTMRQLLAAFIKRERQTEAAKRQPAVAPAALLNRIREAAQQVEAAAAARRPPPQPAAATAAAQSTLPHAHSPNSQGTAAVGGGHASFGAAEIAALAAALGLVDPSATEDTRLRTAVAEGGEDDRAAAVQRGVAAADRAADGLVARGGPLEVRERGDPPATVPEPADPCTIAEGTLQQDRDVLAVARPWLPQHVSPAGRPPQPVTTAAPAAEEVITIDDSDSMTEEPGREEEEENKPNPDMCVDAEERADGEGGAEDVEMLGSGMSSSDEGESESAHDGAGKEDAVPQPQPLGRASSYDALMRPGNEEVPPRQTAPAAASPFLPPASPCRFAATTPAGPRVGGAGAGGGGDDSSSAGRRQLPSAWDDGCGSGRSGGPGSAMAAWRGILAPPQDSRLMDISNGMAGQRGKSATPPGCKGFVLSAVCLGADGGAAAGEQQMQE